MRRHPVSFRLWEYSPCWAVSFTPDEDQLDHSKVLLLSHRLWQEYFGSNPAIVGQNINMDGQVYLISGVMPASFQFPRGSHKCGHRMAWTDKEEGGSGRASFGSHCTPQARHRV